MKTGEGRSEARPLGRWGRQARGAGAGQGAGDGGDTVIVQTRVTPQEKGDGAVGAEPLRRPPGACPRICDMPAGSEDGDGSGTARGPRGRRREAPTVQSSAPITETLAPRAPHPGTNPESATGRYSPASGPPHQLFAFLLCKTRSRPP